MTVNSAISRRRLLFGTALISGGASLMTPLVATAASWPTAGGNGNGNDKSLRLRHLHTGESLVVSVDQWPAQDAGIQRRLRHFLRDHYSSDEGAIDPRLVSQLRSLYNLLGTDTTIEVISGFRSAATNERLRKRGGGGVASRSLHLEGRAMDIRLTGVPLAQLRDAALELRAGGVGYYARSNFVHIDTGRVRRWG